MGSSGTFLRSPEREVDWKDKTNLKNVKKYKPKKVDQLRILVCGPVAAGKSSFINSIYTALRFKSAISASCNSANDRTKSFTVKYTTYKFKKENSEDDWYPFVFLDTMGVEPGDEEGVLPEDLEMAMKGHVKEGYRFDPSATITEDHEYYNDNPSPNDKVHVLVIVLSANVPDMNRSVIEKIQKIRGAARDLGVPQMAIVTNIDGVCGQVEKDVKNVYKSNPLKNKMNVLSSLTGIPLNCMFPVKNYIDGKLEKEDDTDTLLMYALERIQTCGDDFLNNLATI